MTDSDASPAQAPAPGGQSDVLRVFQTKDQTRAFYDKIAGVYDLLSEKSEQPMREAGLTLLDAQPGEKILEIGFGTGHCVVELANAVGPDGRVFGLDLSQQMLDKAAKNCQDAGVAERTELSLGDAAHLPYSDESLDGIFTSFTLELFDTPEIPDVLAECRRVLKPGGRLVVVSVSREGKPGAMVHIFEWAHKHFPNLMDCRPIHTRQAIESAGFEVVKTQIEHMWVPVEIVLARKP